MSCRGFADGTQAKLGHVAGVSGLVGEAPLEMRKWWTCGACGAIQETAYTTQCGCGQGKAVGSYHPTLDEVKAAFPHRQFAEFGGTIVQFGGETSYTPDAVVVYKSDGETYRDTPHGPEKRISKGARVASPIIVHSHRSSMDGFSKVWGEKAMAAWMSAHPDLEVIEMLDYPAHVTGRIADDERILPPRADSSTTSKKPAKKARQRSTPSKSKRPEISPPPKVEVDEISLARLENRLDLVNAKLKQNDTEYDRYSGFKTNPANDVGGIRSRSSKQKNQLHNKWSQIAQDSVRLNAEKGELESKIKALQNAPKQAMDTWRVDAYIKLAIQPDAWIVTHDSQYPMQVKRVNSKSVTVDIAGDKMLYRFDEIAITDEHGGVLPLSQEVLAQIKEIEATYQ